MEKVEACLVDNVNELLGFACKCLSNPELAAAE
jgi:hypothetical protein